MCLESLWWLWVLLSLFKVMEFIRTNLRLYPIEKNPPMRKKDVLPVLNFSCVLAQNYSSLSIKLIEGPLS